MFELIISNLNYHINYMKIITRGAREVHLWALKWKRYFSFWQTWDTVGTMAPKVHERGTRGASLNLPTTSYSAIIVEQELPASQEYLVRMGDNKTVM